MPPKLRILVQALLTLTLVLGTWACSRQTVGGGGGGDQDDAAITTKKDIGPRPDSAGPLDFALTYPEGGGCGPSSCTGCCLPGGICVGGNGDTQCGRGGAWCLDCVAMKYICKLGTCATACKPQCAGKTCGDPDGCNGTCKAGSGCCTPKCMGKPCGASDGCSGTCKPGGGCCTPSCKGKPCGGSDGCTGTCKPGSGCCTPSCTGKSCGASDGCSGTCQPGSGCCTPKCSGKMCGESDGCFATCSGPCDGFAKCDSKNTCKCGPSPHYKWVGGICKASCGSYLTAKGWTNIQMGCCGSKGCNGRSSAMNETHDCVYCCENSGVVCK